MGVSHVIIGCVCGSYQGLGKIFPMTGTLLNKSGKFTIEKFRGLENFSGAVNNFSSTGRIRCGGLGYSAVKGR